MFEKSLFKKIKTKPYISLVLLFVMVFCAIAFIGIGHCFAAEGDTQSPDIWNTILLVVGWIIYFFAYVLGMLATFLIKILVWVASFNNITKVPAVTIGWGVLRDICNMFFILILLVISFATILKLENYSAKRLLPKLLIMAVLINFSKFICGVIIDFGQVVMLTFINGLGTTPGNEFVDRFHMKEFLSFKDSNGEIGNGAYSDATTALTATGAIFMGLIAVIITCVVITIMMVMLLMRVIMLWIFVIMSPLAFVASILPATSKYASQWWNDFIKWVTIGPVVAFFVWLALVGLWKGNSAGGDTVSILKSGSSLTEINQNGYSDLSASDNKLFTEASFLPFIITIALLMGGLIAAQSAGGVAGAMAGGAIARIKRAPGSVGRRAASVGRGAGSAATDLGLSAANKPLRAGLGRMAAAGGIGGAFLGAVGLRRAATSGLVGMDRRQKRKDKDADEYIKNISDPRVLTRIANGSAITPWQKSVKDAARAKAPSLVDASERQSAFNDLGEDEIKKIKANEWRRLGREHHAGRINLSQNSQAAHYIQKNSVIRGEVNAGADEAYNDTVAVRGGARIAVGTRGAVDAAGQPMFRGYDANGNPNGPTTGSVGNFRRAGNFNSYRKVEEDEMGAARGDGNMSVTTARFLSGKSNTIAADLDSLNIKELKENEGDEFRNMKGVNVTDSETIKKVAEKMVSAIDSELKTLGSRRSAIESKSNANITLDDQKELQRIEAKEQQFMTAKDRLMKPEEMKNLRLVNSSAHGYKGHNDVKKTMIHEEIHDHVKDEGATEKLTQYMLDNHKYSKTDDMAKEFASSGKTVDEFIDDHSRREGWKAPERKSVNDVVAAEAGDYDSGKESGSGSKEPATDNVKQRIQEVVSGTGDMGVKAFKELAMSIQTLNKALKQQSSTMKEGLGQVSANLADITDIDTDKASPLEVSVVQKQIQKIQEEDKLI